jgi:hypothetical protein
MQAEGRNRRRSGDHQAATTPAMRSAERVRLHAIGAARRSPKAGFPATGGGGDRRSFQNPGKLFR